MVTCERCGEVSVGEFSCPNCGKNIELQLPTVHLEYEDELSVRGHVTNATPTTDGTIEIRDDDVIIQVKTEKDVEYGETVTVTGECVDGVLVDADLKHDSNPQ